MTTDDLAKDAGQRALAPGLRSGSVSAAAGSAARFVRFVVTATEAATLVRGDRLRA